MESISDITFSSMPFAEQVSRLRYYIFVCVKLLIINPEDAMRLDEAILDAVKCCDDTEVCSLLLLRIAKEVGFVKPFV